MTAKIEDPSQKRDFMVMVRFKPTARELLAEAVQKSGEKTLSAYIRKAAWEYAKQITGKG